MKADPGQEAVYIPDDSEIRVYKDPLPMTVRLKLFGSVFYFDENPFWEVVSSILPHGGRAFFQCQKVAVKDTEPDIEPSVFAELQKPAFNSEDSSRFGGSQNSLEDLVRVRTAVDKGSCVMASLYSPQYGESLVVVYGYTASGNLLVADYETMKPLGEILIDMRAIRMMDAEGRLTQVEWFQYNGCGFSSVSGDRISFFAASPENEKEGSK